MEKLGRFFLVKTVLFQGGKNILLLKFVHNLFERLSVVGNVHAGLTLQKFRHIRYGEVIPFAEDYRALHNILKFADFPFPLMLDQQPHGGIVYAFDVFAHFAAVLIKKMLDEEGDILPAF